MKNFLQDLIQHTYSLGIIELIKVECSTTETKVSAYSEDRKVIVSGVSKVPIAELQGTFGMPNLSKLKTILSFDEYDNKAKINVIREDKGEEKNVPISIHFETEVGDFVNDYRLMAKSVIEDKIKTVIFKGATWNVELVPAITSIQKMKKQASANNEELNFVARTDKGDLRFYFGDVGTNNGNFVFQSNVNGVLTKSWNWPVKVFMAIMDLPGNKVIKFSDGGAVEITVDSGIADYRYLLPAEAK